MRQKVLIGGLSLFGSGNYLREYAQTVSFDRQYDYNATGFAFVCTLVKSAKKLFRSEVHFQPAICFPAFARDVLIVILLRLLCCKVVFVVLSELHYRNPVLKTKAGRRLFFWRSRIISSAPLCGENYKLPSEVRSPNVVGEDLPNADISELGAILHLGYLSDIKGFDLFLEQAKRSPRRFAAIGALLREARLETSDIEVNITTSRDEFLGTLEKFIKGQKILCFLFCSRYDLSPLLLMELRKARIPLVAIKGTDGARILANYLKPDCYNLVSDLAELDDENLVLSLKFAAEALAISTAPTMQDFGGA